MTSQDAAEPDQNIQLLELTQDDIDKMLEIMYVSRAGLQQRFSRGDRCFAVLDKSKILSYFWVRLGERHVPELHWKFNLQAHQAWLYNAVTAKQARGRGLYPSVIRHMAKVMVAEGINELFVDVEQRNCPSIRGVEKAGCKKIAKVKIKKIFSKRKYYLHIFDEEAWQRLSETISDYPQKQCVMEEMVHES